MRVNARRGRSFDLFSASIITVFLVVSLDFRRIDFFFFLEVFGRFEVIFEIFEQSVC